jgi:hypothetical protein
VPASSPIVFILPMLALILVPVVGGNVWTALLTAAVAALASHLAWAIATAFRTRHLEDYAFKFPPPKRRDPRVTTGSLAKCDLAHTSFDLIRCNGPVG